MNDKMKAYYKAYREKNKDIDIELQILQIMDLILNLEDTLHKGLNWKRVKKQEALAQCREQLAILQEKKEAS